MSPLWKKAELTVGLCPDRLIVAPSSSTLPAGKSDPLDSLKELSAGRKLRVIVSNHFVRYAVLPWSATLTSQGDWTAFAEHRFSAVYGDSARTWRVRVSNSGARNPRVACAVDATLLDSLNGIPSVVSVQPYLMAAFNARRRSLRERSFWFVVQESGRLTLAFIEDDVWIYIRNRQASEHWTEFLAELLEREAAAANGSECDRVVVCSESAVAATIGRYRIRDETLLRGASTESRPLTMALH